ncbi:MAG: DUF503 domain-containing protein [Phycisphaerae bacterium]|nr:DUF503 domain-containing protein [Phycisphaerae bacterium]
MATVLALLHLDLHVPQAGSLKDKRRIVKSFKDRVIHRYHVSVAEVDGHETHRRVTLAVAMVGNDRDRVAGILQTVWNLAAKHRDMILIDHTIEWL